MQNSYIWRFILRGLPSRVVIYAGPALLFPWEAGAGNSFLTGLGNKCSLVNGFSDWEGRMESRLAG